MKNLRSLVLSVLLCAAIMTATVLPASAQEATSQEPTTVEVQSTPLLDDRGDVIPGRVLLIATLNTEGGQPVSERELSFYERIEFFGSERNADLGTGLTDVTGTAVIAYQPSTLEDHSIWAKFDGDANFTTSDSATIAVRVESLSPTFETEGPPLEIVRRWLPWAVGLIVLATWAVVLGTLGWAVRGIRRTDMTEQPA